MPASKKCVYCKTLNSPDRFYCSNCGKFLNSKTTVIEKPKTIWETGTAVQPQIGLPRVSPVSVDEFAVRCPMCSNIVDAPERQLPGVCLNCGYIFQRGIDLVVLKTQLKQKTSPAPVSQQAATLSQPVDSSPMPKVSFDKTTMRLISIGMGNMMPEVMNEKGNYIGFNGTSFRQLNTVHRIFIWHTQNGWYVRAENGQPVRNGVYMNPGQSRRCENGDTFNLDNYEFRVEIL